MSEPPKLYHHVIQRSASNVWFSSTQSDFDEGHWSAGRGGLIVVKARPWEEEGHGKILEMMRADLEVTIKLNRTVEDGMMTAETAV